MAESHAEVMGIVLLSRLGFLREQGGRALEQVLARLAPADAAVLRGVVPPRDWYPLGLQLRVDQAIATSVPADVRPKILVQVGRASAEAMLRSGDWSHIISIHLPQVLLAAAPRVFRAHITAGRHEYQRLDHRSGIIRTFGAAHLATPDYCLTVVGWLERALELCGAGGVLVSEVACRAAGATCCEYRCKWHGEQ